MPTREIATEQTTQSDDQVSGVPSDHTQPKAEQQTLNWDYAEALLVKEITQPQSHYGAKAVAD
jgi:hypothetical protein